MNSYLEKCGNKCGRCAYVVAIIGSLLIVGALVRIMYHYTQPAPLGEDRAEVRSKALKELRAANEDVLNHYAWQDQAKGVVRMPIAQAMDMSLQMWQSPAAARSNLVARVEKATAVPPPQTFE